jgi:hypothetical protein
LVLQGRAGHLNISVFASPSPLRAGMADLSVLLQDAADGGILLDSAVELRLTKSGAPSIVAIATTGQATNKLLYAAAVDILEPGKYVLTALCREHGEEVSIHGTLTVLPRQPAVLDYWFYFAIVPVAILLFLLNQRLKSRRRAVRLPARP